jgi:hypothetical protein
MLSYWLQLSHNSGTPSTLTTLHNALPPLPCSQYELEFNRTPCGHDWHPLDPSARWRCRVHGLTPPSPPRRETLTTWDHDPTWRQNWTGMLFRKTLAWDWQLFYSDLANRWVTKIILFPYTLTIPKIGLSCSPHISNTSHSISDTSHGI